jgi:hypothetical protein
MTSMMERPVVRDLALVAVAAVLGWWAHTVDATAQAAIERVLETKVLVRLDSCTSLHGNVVLTAWTRQHTIQIALQSGGRTA